MIAGKKELDELIREVIRALKKSERKFQSASAFIVGGFPRDIILGEKPYDIDVIVFDADYVAFAKEVANELGTQNFFIVENYNLVRIKIGDNGQIPFTIDISKPKGESIEKDLRKRDFTINTLAIPIKLVSELNIKESIIDPLGESLIDIETKTLRTPVSPFNTIKSDPARIIRTARFISDFFNPEEKLFSACKKLVRNVAQLPKERIGEELIKLFLAKKPSLGLIFLRDIGFFHFVYPKIVPALYKEQISPYHFEGVFEHCARVTDLTPPDLVMRLSAFFHDIGKAFAEKKLPDGRYVYWGHEKISKEIAHDFLYTFGFPSDVRKKVEFIVENHMINYSSDWSDSAVRRLIKKLGENIDIVLNFVKYDIEGLKDPKPKLVSLEELKKRVINEILKLGKAEIKSPLNGYEIQKIFGIPPGKFIGEIKKEIENAIVEGKIKPTKEDAIKFVRELLLKKRNENAKQSDTQNTNTENEKESSEKESGENEEINKEISKVESKSY